MHLERLKIFIGKIYLFMVVILGIFLCSISNAADIYTATFELNGADSIGENILGGSSVTAPSITRSGWNILGWSTDSGATEAEYEIGDTIPLSDDITLYAITSKVYTATFNKNGATSIGTNSASCTIYNRETSCGLGKGYITICNPSDTGECITMMDRNLGANSAGLGYCAYGNYYQWGNNYGFPSEGILSTGSNRIDCTAYGIGNNYSSNIFFVGTGDWCQSENSNLWGGGSDGGGNGYGYPATNSSERRGPCPEGYHVPGAGEWGKIILWRGQMYISGGNNIYLNTSVPYLPEIWNNGEARYQFQKNFQIPMASNRISTSVVSGDFVYNAWLLTTTPESYPRVRVVYLNDSDVGFSNVTRAGGYSVRCFKDFTSSSSGTSYGQSSLSTTTISREGWTILGWDKSPDSITAEYDVCEEIELTGDISLYAITKREFTATFELNGADSVGYDSISCMSYSLTGCTVIAPSITKDGDIILGWSTNSGALRQDYMVGDTITLTGDSTFYAITSPIYYTATFDLNGADSVESTLLTGINITLPSIVRTGGTIIGWNTDSGALEAKYQIGDTVELDGDTTFYAITKKTYTITFYPNGADNIQVNTLSCDVYNDDTTCMKISSILDGISYTNNVIHTVGADNIGLYIICNPSNKRECLAMMDKNLGASAVGTYSDSYGYFYQWGNNNGFISTTSFPSSTSNRVYTTTNGPGNYYSGSSLIFMTGTPYDWSMNINNNLWGGSGDDISNNYGYPMMNPTDRQGPCPEGYHVPSIGERKFLFERWASRYKSAGNYLNLSYIDSLPYFSKDESDFNKAYKKFQQDFSIPFVGYYTYKTYLTSKRVMLDLNGLAGYLWSSSTQNRNARFFEVSNINNIPTVGADSASVRQNAMSLRCFKNTSSIVPLRAPRITRYGGTTLGWSTDSGNITPEYQVGDVLLSSGDIVLYAVTQRDVVLKFDSKGGTPVDPQTGSFYNMMDISMTGIKPSNPSRANSIFSGWYLSGSDTEFDFQNTPITGDTTLYAHRDCEDGYFLSQDGQSCDDPVYNTVVFNTKGGSSIDTQNVLSGESINYIIPSKTGSVFLGWYFEVGDIEHYIINTDDTDYPQGCNTVGLDNPSSRCVLEIPTKSKNFSGYLYISPYSTEVTRNANDAQTYCQNDVTIFGYTWKLPHDKSSDVGAERDGLWQSMRNKRSKIYNNLDASAQGQNNEKPNHYWAANGNNCINTAGNCGSASSSIVMATRCVTTSNTPIVSYELLEYSSGDSVSQDLQLFAKWNCESGYILSGDDCIWPTYHITFNSNGGSMVSGQEIPATYIGTKPVDPSRANSIFSGWYLSGSDTEFDFQNTPITGDTTLYAHWDCEDGYLLEGNECVIKNTVTLDPNGGETMTGNVLINSGATFDLSKYTASKVGFAFVGWGDSSDATEPLSENPTITGNLTLYALYKIDTNNNLIADEYERYSIIFNSLGGNILTSHTGIHLYETGEKPVDPSRANSIFSGWYLSGSDTEFDFQNTPITGDITLYAHWDCATGYISQNGACVEKFVVILNATTNQGVATTGLVEIGSGGILNLSEYSASKEGYIFKGWSLSSTGAIVNSIVVRGNMTVYALFYTGTILKDDPDFTWNEIVISKPSGYEGDGPDSYIIMDRNLGASTSGTGDNTSAYGYYYQWGNDYGFGNIGTVPTAVKTDVNVNLTLYGPRINGDTPYYSGVYIIAPTTVVGNRTDWAKNNNENIWGDVTDSDEARQGPCPEGWHIPSQGEWSGAMAYWKLGSGGGTMNTTKFINDLKLPWAGNRARSDAALYETVGNTTLLWSTTPKAAAGDVYILKFSTGTPSVTQSTNRVDGVPVRCFKNSIICDGLTHKIGNECISNTKVGYCTTGESLTNGNYIGLDNEIIIHWTGGEWETVMCDIVCNTGYEQSGNNCVEREINCDENYHQEGFECIPNTKTGYCTQASGLQNGIYTGINSLITINWTGGEWENVICDIICDESYDLSGNKCTRPGLSIIFDAGSGTNVPSIYGLEAGTDMSNLRPTTDPKWKNHMFLGWFDDSTNTGTRFKFQGTILTEDLVLTAHWAEFEDIVYTGILNGVEKTIIMMDRNLGATATGAGINQSVDTYGYYYQWGNNYGFYYDPSNTINENTTGLVDASGYGPGNRYYGETFIAAGNDYDWSSSSNNNLWGGSGDKNSGYDNGNYRYMRQGPCPKGYHVPSLDEWHTLLSLFLVNNGITDNKTWPNYVGNKANADYNLGDTNRDLFASTFYIPAAGRIQGNYETDRQDQRAPYWSSSMKEDKKSLGFEVKWEKTEINMGGWSDGRTQGKLIRCFKNDDDYTITWKNENGDILEVDDTVGHGETPIYYGITPTKSGQYIFSGWDKEIIPATGDAEYTAVYREIITEKTYTVRHRLENADDNNYTLITGDTETLSGIAGSNTQAVSKIYTGFTANLFEQETINVDGSTVVDIYYDRNIYTITIDLNGGTGVESLTGKYGQALEMPTPTRAGYRIANWVPAFPETMPLNGTSVQVVWESLERNLRINVNPLSSTLNLGLKVSNDDQIISGSFSENTFQLHDMSCRNTGYYTTLSVSNLLGTDTVSISATNIQIKSDGIMMISGSTVEELALQSVLTGRSTAVSPVTYFERGTVSMGNECKMGDYGDNLYLKVTIPGHTRPDNYHGTITYTLIEE